MWWKQSARHLPVPAASSLGSPGMTLTGEPRPGGLMRQVELKIICVLKLDRI